MRYISTRGGGEERTFTEILLEGLAPDGGLYVPKEYPHLHDVDLTRMRSMSYAELAFDILSRFADDLPQEELRRIVFDTYTKEVFGTEAIVPLKKLESDVYLLDLSEGPTLAFKDIALQFLGRLFEYVLKESGEHLNIFAATSGDTGSAAEYAMRGRSGINVFMLSPYGRMSEFQRKQMYTLQDKNIFNLAVRGTFDDCQDVVKEVNADADFKKRYALGAVNSINWARIAAQVVYYVWGYLRVTDNESRQVSFAVPTGNFGDIHAGYIARSMGVPIRHLYLATNENNVLEEFFKRGVYRPRTGSEVHTTSSPSMDISKASNFERYFFDLVGRDVVKMQALWGELQQRGSFDISGTSEFKKIAETGIVAGSSTHADRIEAIRSLHTTYGILIDPHTADGVTTGMRLKQKGETVLCLETALPAKFAETIREAVGTEPAYPERFADLEKLSERVEIFDADAAAIKRFIAELA